MTINQDFPIYDGVAPSWADVKFNFKGYNTPLLQLKDLASFETTASLEVGDMQGASGGKIIRTTTGASKYEGKMGLYHSGFHDLLDNLGPSMPTRGDLRIYGVVFFDVQLFWTPPGSNEIFEKQVNGCRILGNTLAAAEGVEANKIDIPIKVAEVIYVIRGKKYVIL